MEEDKEEKDIYDEGKRSEMLESDEIDVQEESFMQGYDLKEEEE